MILSRIARSRHKPKSAKHHSRKRRGAATLEMALVAPFVFLIAFASMEFSRVVMIKQALTNSAREGCRIATLATTQSDSDVESEVRFYLRRCVTVSGDQDVVEITTTPSNLTDLPSRSQITTHVSINFSEVSWLPPRWTGDLVLIGTATMRRE